jgi:hypothetical protein
MASREHEKAEELSAAAANAARADDAVSARRLYLEAADSERMALEQLGDRSTRTWGILATSAAYLYFKSGDYEEAQDFVSSLLRNAEMRRGFREELTSLLEEIHDELSKPESPLDPRTEENQAVRDAAMRLIRANAINAPVLDAEALLMISESRRAVELVIRESIGRLKPRGRLILELYLDRGMTSQDIGKSLGASHAAVWRTLSDFQRSLFKDVDGVLGLSPDVELSEEDRSILIEIVRGIIIQVLQSE